MLARIDRLNSLADNSAVLEMPGKLSFHQHRNDGGEEGVACWQSPFALVTELKDAKHQEETR